MCKECKLGENFVLRVRSVLHGAGKYGILVTMKRFRRISLVAALCVCLSILAMCMGGCQKKVWNGTDYAAYTSKQYVTTQYFATPIRVVIQDDFTDPQAAIDADNVWQEICDRLQRIHTAVDTAADIQNADADLARWNALDGVQTQELEVGQDTYRILEAAKEAYRLTDGAFNPCMARSADLWGFSPRFYNDDAPQLVYPYDRTDPKTALPNDTYVQAFGAFADVFAQIELTQWTDEQNVAHYSVTKPEGAYAVVDGVTYPAWMDLGGIAKGYAADVATSILREHGYSFGYVSIGTSSISALCSIDYNTLAPAQVDWTLGVRHPRSPQDTYVKIFVHDATVSTSGDYERYYEIDGVRYCHIIDPRSGKPLQGDRYSVTVIADNAALADALSTAILIDGTQANWMQKNRAWKYAAYGSQGLYTDLDASQYLHGTRK